MTNIKRHIATLIILLISIAISVAQTRSHSDSIFPPSELLGLNYDAWFTIIVVVILFSTLTFTRVRTELAFFVAMTTLFVFGVVDMKGAFGGFSSETMMMVAMLYVVIAGLSYTGVLNLIVKYLMGTPKTFSGAIVRLMMPVAILSSVLTNASVVALFINVVQIWSKRLGISPSKLLIPLSYASGMGGICTLIGTAPNLIISGLYAEETGVRLSVLTPLLCGLFCLFVGIISVIALQKLLPQRKSPIEGKGDEEFTTELLVPSNNHYIGYTYAEVKKEKEDYPKDINVVAVRRFDNEIVSDVTEEEFLMGGDRLIVTGKIESILRLCREMNFRNEYLNGIMEYDIENRQPGRKTIISTVIMLAMVMLSAFNVMPLLHTCLLAAIGMVIFRCCNANQAVNSINWRILVIVAGSICIGKAIESTGIAQMLAESLLSLCGTNPLAVLGVICLVTTFVTEFISNTAAAAMFYPIAMSSATTLGVNPLTFCIALMISASSSFATPIGSATHMQVYAQGGYRFSDFMKIGLLMNVIILIANIFITTLVFPL